MISRGVLAIVTLSIASALASCVSQAPARIKSALSHPGEVRDTSARRMGCLVDTRSTRRKRFGFLSLAFDSPFTLQFCVAIGRSLAPSARELELLSYFRANRHVVDVNDRFRRRETVAPVSDVPLVEVESVRDELRGFEDRYPVLVQCDRARRILGSHKAKLDTKPLANRHRDSGTRRGNGQAGVSMEK